MGVFEDYLKISHSACANDFPRAITVLDAVPGTSRCPCRAARPTAGAGSQALQELQSHGPTDEALVRARTLIETGQRRNRFPADHQGFVYFVVASSLLHRFLTTPAADGERRALAEAYYLLGVAETYICTDVQALGGTVLPGNGDSP